jgi:gas vesicle protein
MKPKLVLLAAAVTAGYLFGTRSGREKLDKVTAKVRELWEDPRVAAARRDVESYTREQAPVIRERAEAAAKAAGGVIAEGAATAVDVAKDVAEKTSDLAKDVAEKTTHAVKDVAGKTSDVAKDVAEKTTDLAKDVAGKVTDTAGDVRDQAGKVASDLRDRGEAVVDSAVAAAGQARDNALDDLDDADDDSPADKSN